jgi:hypothetical protein
VNYGRKDALIYRSVLTFDPITQRRRRNKERRAAFVQHAKWFGVAALLVGALWFVCVGVIVPQ